MSWRQAATFLVVVFIIVLIQSVLAGPLVTLEDSLISAVDFGSPHFDGAQLIRGLVSTWFNMGLLAVFILAGGVVAMLVRRERTRQRRQP